MVILVKYYFDSYINCTFVIIFKEKNGNKLQKTNCEV